MSRSILFLFASLVVLLALVLSLRTPPEEVLSKDEQPPADLLVYCAASNRAVMEAIARDYENEFGTRIELQFGPSQMLLTSVEIGKMGDLFLPADDSYLEIADQKGLIDETVPLARMQVIVGVPIGNPLGIRSFSDLLKPEVRVVQASPDVAAVGKLVRDALKAQGKWELLDQHTQAYRSTVTEAANDVAVGAADAALVYDAVLPTYPCLEAIRIEEFQDTFANVKIGILKASTRPDLARHFARYLSAKDRGLKRYAEFGFTPVDGVPWVPDEAAP